jgi:hypothetical protein
MFKLSVLHVWFKTFGWKHPVCSTCLLHVWFNIFRLNHPVCLICQYYEEQTTWTYRVIPSKFWTRQVEHTRWLHQSFEPYMKNRQVEYRNTLYVQLVYLISGCQYFMSGSKSLDGITLYVQIVCSSCLVQNFWMETPCMCTVLLCAESK